MERDVDELIDRIQAYFTRPQLEVFERPDGSTDVRMGDFPTAKGWLADNDLTEDEFGVLCATNPNLQRAVVIAYQRLEHLLANAGLKGEYKEGMTILMGKNWFKWRDKTEIETTKEIRVISDDSRKVLAQLGVQVLDG